MRPRGRTFLGQLIGAIPSQTDIEWLLKARNARLTVQEQAGTNFHARLLLPTNELDVFGRQLRLDVKAFTSTLTRLCLYTIPSNQPLMDVTAYLTHVPTTITFSSENIQIIVALDAKLT